MCGKRFMIFNLKTKAQYFNKFNIILFFILLYETNSLFYETNNLYYETTILLYDILTVHYIVSMLHYNRITEDYFN